MHWLTRDLDLGGKLIVMHWLTRGLDFGGKLIVMHWLIRRLDFCGKLSNTGSLEAWILVAN